MKLFDKTTSYMIITGEEIGKKAKTFAELHRVMCTTVDARRADELYTVTFTTRLDRAELAKKLRTIFGETHNVRIRNRVVLLTKRIDAQ